MGEFSDMVLIGNLKESHTKTAPKEERSISDMVLGLPDEPKKEDITKDYKETGAISTITGKPEVELSATGQTAPSFMTHVKSGFVDDPIAKIKIYAKARGIPANRYRIVDGEIVYRGNDGKWYQEVRDLPTTRISRGVGEMVPRLPAGIMAAIGATSGPFAAALGAAGGEGIRKSVGGLAFGEDQTTAGNVGDMAVEGLLAAAFAGGGKAANKTINYLGRKRGGALASAAGKSADLIDPKSAAMVKKAGKDVGVDLLPPQTTGSKRLADKFNLLGDLESSSPIIQTARKKQAEQINNAVYKFLDTVSPESTSLEVGQAVSKASKQGIENLKGARSGMVSGLYKQAKGESGVDVTGTIQKLNGLLDEAPQGSATNRALVRIKRMLTRKVKDQQGKLIDVPEDRIKVLDRVKKEINSMWKADPKNAPEKDAQIEIKKILDDMLEGIDKQVPAYAEARAAFSENYLNPIIKRAESGIPGQLSKLEGDKVAQASKRLFSSIDSTPETVSYAKGIIKANDPDAWNGALRTYLQDTFEKTKLSAGGVDVTTNMGGNFFKRTMGDPQQKKILKAAMSDSQWDYFEKLSTVMERAGMILRKESATATRQELIEDIGGKTSKKIIRAATMPLYTYKRAIGEGFTKARLNFNAERLARAMTTEDAAETLLKIYKMSPTSEKFLPAVSTFLGLTGIGSISQARSRAMMPDLMYLSRGSEGKLR